MANSVSSTHVKGVRAMGLITLIAGIVLIIAGAVTWWTVADQLAAEQITVSDDASFLAGKQVNDPFSAFAQAQVINKHALEASDGLTYAELEQGDPRRDTVMTASFLRASLFTSVVAFGVAALVVGIGILFIIVGWALRRLAVAGPPVDAGTHGAHYAPAVADETDATVPSAAPRRAAPPVEPAVVAPPGDGTPVAAPVVDVPEATVTPAPAAAAESAAETTDGAAEWTSPADRVPPAEEDKP